MLIDFFPWLDIIVEAVIGLWVLLIIVIVAMYFTLGKFKRW